MDLAYEVKIYPNKGQTAILEELFDTARICYNSILERKISHFKDNGTAISRSELQKEYKTQFQTLPASLRQTLIYRVNNSFQFFFRKNAKFPRFKAKNRFRSIELRQFGQDYRFKDNKLETWRILGKLRMRGFRPADNYGMGRIVKRATGWYFVYSVEVKENSTIKPKTKVGIDVGIKSFVADSDGNIIISPKYFVNTQKQLAVAQRKLSKAKMGGGRRAKKRLLVAKIHQKIASQRKDWLHKLAKKYADKYDFVAVEDLNIAGMMKNHHLAKHIADASWDAFLTMLDYKLKKLGKTFVKVAPHYTSQTCICGARVPKSLSVRTHVCPECGYTDDRDVVSAKVILKKAWDKPAARLVR